MPAAFMQMRLVNSNTPILVPNPPTQQQTTPYRLGSSTARKCLPLVVQGNKRCSSCGGK